MASMPEELAYELSRSTFESAVETDKRLRDRAAGLLSAASVVIPVAGIAVSHGPTGVAVAFGLAALAYCLCAYFCSRVLIPEEFMPGPAGSLFLDSARESGATLAQMYATAALYLDQARETNGNVASASADNVEIAIRWLVAELSLLAVSLVITIVG